MSNTEFNFAKLVVVLISGRAGTGKTTAAKFMSAYLDHPYSIANAVVPFASSLKNIAKVLGWDGNKDDKGRKFLIDLGAVGREYDKDCWCKQTEVLIENFCPDASVILIDDWRFPNEFEFFQKSNYYQTFTVRIYSPERELLKGTQFYNDLSETSLPEYDVEHFYDYTIINKSTLLNFESNCKAIISDIIKNSTKWE